MTCGSQSASLARFPEMCLTTWKVSILIPEGSFSDPLVIYQPLVISPVANLVPLKWVNHRQNTHRYHWGLTSVLSMGCLAVWLLLLFWGAGSTEVGWGMNSHFKLLLSTCVLWPVWINMSFLASRTSFYPKVP